jgi:hypothetical protein
MAQEGMIGAAFAVATTNPTFKLGTMAWDDGGKAFVYVQADGAITGDGYVVSITNAFQAKMTNSGTAATILQGNKVGVADVAFADNEYGWVQVYGPCGIRCHRHLHQRHAPRHRDRRRGCGQHDRHAQLADVRDPDGTRDLRLTLSGIQQRGASVPRSLSRNPSDGTPHHG